MADQASYGGRGDVSHHETFLLHARLRWLKVAVLLSLAAAIAFYATNAPTGFLHMPHTGGTWAGYALGIAGALIMVWLTLIGIRKRRMSAGAWSLKAWVSAHVYLGLSLTVIVTLHTGFQFGLNIHTLAYILMLLVIASGMFGVIAYMFLPRRLSEVRAEMTKQQMRENILLLDRRILDAAQPLDSSQAARVRLSLDRTILVGNVFQRVTGWYSSCGNATALARLDRAGSGASDDQRKALEFIRNLMESKQKLLVQARRYVRIRTLLEAWLYIHVPMTFAMLAALIAHIVSVLFF